MIDPIIFLIKFLFKLIYFPISLIYKLIFAVY